MRWYSARQAIAAVGAAFDVDAGVAGISDEYPSRALLVLSKRLVQSGLRLARLLNQTLK
jgi:hypothetical protein